MFCIFIIDLHNYVVFSFYFKFLIPFQLSKIETARVSGRVCKETLFKIVVVEWEQKTNCVNQLCLFCKLWWEFAIKEDVKLEEAVAWLPGYILNKHLRKNSKARVTTKNGLVIYNVTWSLACIHAQLKRQTIELKGLQKYQDFFQRLIHTDSFFLLFWVFTL